MVSSSEQVKHEPVLLDQVMKYLDVSETDIIIDGTLGLGGHSSSILKELGSTGKLIGFDLDSRNMQQARKRLKKYEGKVLFVNDSYEKVSHYARVLRFSDYNKVLLDLGVSSPHFDVAEYGFSFKHDGPLDMRFDDGNSITAGMIINRLPEDKLVEIFRNYGELSEASKLAKTIIKEREIEPFVYTVDFADRIKKCFSVKDESKKLTLVFQALRIAVNDELNVLYRGLRELYEGLAPGGRMVVISYHSLEDRIVKKFFNELANPIETSIEKSLKSVHGDPLIEVLTKKIITASEEEISANPRARSAKLRAIRKI